MAAKNQDCPLNEVIKTASECVIAAEEQGLQIDTSVGIGPFSERPAGCYKWNGFNGTKGASFNTILDPSSTSPMHNSAGLCKKGNIVYLRMVLFIIYLI